MIEVELPDGTVVEFPDGTDATAIKAALAKIGGAPAQPSGGVPEGMFLNPVTGQMTSREMLRDAGPVTRGGAALEGFVQGGTFRFGDELAGMVGALEGGEDMATFRREQARARAERAQEAYPWTYGLSEAGGGIATTGAAMAMAPAAVAGAGAAPLTQQALRGAAMGAIEGAAYGAGGGEGAAGRLSQAAKYGATGAVIGGLAPVAVQGVREGVARVRGAVGTAPSATQASRGVQRAIDRSGRSANDIDAAIRAARAAGQPYTVADATGNAGQRMLSGIARAPGDARQEIAEYLYRRQGDQGGRLARAIDDALNAPRNLSGVAGQAPADFTNMTAKEVAERLSAARSRAADVAYAAARTQAGPVDVRAALSVIDNRIGPMQGSGLATDGIDGLLSRFRNRLAAAKPSGGALSVELSDFSRVLGVKQDVQDAIGAAVRAGRNNEARELGKLISSLDDALEAASPAYRAANDDFARASRIIDQIEAGTKAASPRVRSADTAAAYARLTPEQQATFRVGYSDPTLAKIENAAPGVNKARALTSDGVRGDLRTMASDPDALEAFIARENDMFATLNRATGGSMTADNLADAAEMTALDTPMIMNALSGNWRTLGQQLGSRGVNALAGRNTATRAELARMLLSDDVQNALAPALRAATIDTRLNALAGLGVRAAGRAALPY